VAITDQLGELVGGFERRLGAPPVFTAGDLQQRLDMISFEFRDRYPPTALKSSEAEKAEKDRLAHYRLNCAVEGGCRDDAGWWRTNLHVPLPYNVVHCLSRGQRQRNPLK